MQKNCAIFVFFLCCFSGSCSAILHSGILSSPIPASNPNPWSSVVHSCQSGPGIRHQSRGKYLHVSQKANRQTKKKTYHICPVVHSSVREDMNSIVGTLEIKRFPSKFYMVGEKTKAGIFSTTVLKIFNMSNIFLFCFL